MELILNSNVILSGSEILQFYRGRKRKLTWRTPFACSFLVFLASLASWRFVLTAAGRKAHKVSAYTAEPMESLAVDSRNPGFS
ncbi:MAG: hypothetical protein DMG05_23360 [Acidobacteria bacterium]|nr:MAG: hypothetical protein DMG05_23360 [Acidobacteriota bacterium]